jgi:hypothetical protein
MATNERIVVAIERLVLDGFPPLDQHRLGSAVERELEHLLNDGDLPSTLAGGGTLSHLEASPVRAPSDSDLNLLAAQIAQAVYGALNA